VIHQDAPDRYHVIENVQTEPGARNMGLDPTNPDTDGDGLSDGSEMYFAHTDPLDKDTDKDGLWDSKETGPLTRSDVPGMLDQTHASPATFVRAGISMTHYTGTDPLKWDTNSNGVSDAFDDQAGDALENIFEVDKAVDAGGILYTNPNWGITDPRDADTDCDHLKDGWEADPSTAPSGKTSGIASNPTKVDTDGDGLSDDIDPNPSATTVLPATRITQVKVSGLVLDGVRPVWVLKQSTFPVVGYMEYQDSFGAWRATNYNMDVYVYLVQWNGSAYVAKRVGPAVQAGQGGAFTISVRITSDDIRAGGGYLFIQTDILNRDPQQVYYAPTTWTEPNAPAFAIPTLSVCTT